MSLRRLSAQDAVSVWEAALNQRPVERALTILSAALPEASAQEIAAYPIGWRNALLFRSRAAIFGEQINARARCPACGEWLEFAVTAADLGVGDDAPPELAPETLDLDGVRLTFRLPDSRDLAASARCPDAESARDLLIRRCVIDPSPDALTDALIAALAQAIGERDPLSAISLDFACPNCAHGWTAPFDILGYFWEELAAHVKGLTVEVAALARGYGWSEADILAMSAARRQIYLELLTS